MGKPYKYTLWKFITGQPDKNQNPPTIRERLNRIEPEFFAKEKLMMPDDRYQSVSSRYVKQLEENRAALHWVFSEKKKKWWTDKRSGKQKENFYFETGSDFLAGIKLLNENFRPVVEKALHVMYDDEADSELWNVGPDQLQSEISQPLKMMAWSMGHHYEDYSLEVAKTYLLRRELNRLKLIAKTKILYAADTTDLQLEAENSTLQLLQLKSPDQEETLEPVVVLQTETQPEEIDAVIENEAPAAEKATLVLLTEKHPEEDFAEAKIVDIKSKSEKSKSRFSKFAVAATIFLVGAMTVATAFLKPDLNKKSAFANEAKKKTGLVAKQTKAETAKPTVKTKLDSLFVPQTFHFQPFGNFAIVTTKAKEELLAVDKKSEIKKVFHKKKTVHAVHKPSVDMIAKTDALIDKQQPAQDGKQELTASSKQAETLKAVKSNMFEINLPIAGLGKIVIDTTSAKSAPVDTAQTQLKPTPASMDPIGGNGSGMKLKIQSDTVKKDTLNKSGILPTTGSKIKSPDWQHNFSATDRHDNDIVNKMQLNVQEMMTVNGLIRTARTGSLTFSC
jgi:hypothetical protein